jgi:VWFA-related protein
MRATPSPRRDPLLSLLSASILALCATAPAQEKSAPPADAQDQNPYTFRANANVVLVPTQVQTKKGEMIYDLKREQFILEDNGVPQTIKLDEDTDALGLSLVVVVQCSREAYRQFNSLQGLTAMVDDLTGGAPHQVAVVSYGSEPELIADDNDPAFSSDPHKISHNLSQIQPCEDGGAVTLDAVDFANHLFDEDKSIAVSRNRRAILLIGETRDHGSKIKPAAVVANLGRSNTVVDAVSFDPAKTSIVDSLIHGQFGPGPLGLLVAAVEALKKNVPHTLASLSGGEYTNFTTEHGFDAGIHALSNHIHNYYLLSFQPSGPNGEPVTPGLHRIVVKIPDYPDAKIRTRLTYYAGDAPPPDLPDDDKADKPKKKIF